MAFKFRQFKIEDDRCAMKVGTDGVLLGAWVNVNATQRILDIGTGSGLVALMLAQRTPPQAKIDAVDVGEEESTQANENVAHSPWQEKIKIHHSAIQDFYADTNYDLIVSNPPYFNKSLLPPSPPRKAARHTDSLPYEALISSASRLMSGEGRFALILPVKEGNSFISMAQFQKLYCVRQTAVFAKEEKPQERWLLEFSRTPASFEKEKLTLFNNQERSEGYRKLTLDFYLHKR